MNPKISVVIPTYNRKKLTKRAVKSVLDQTFTDFELIIVDDGSTDGTEDYLYTLIQDRRVKYCHKKNEGLPSRARNYGILQCVGEYIAFLDSDDFWFQEKLQKQVKCLEQNKKSALVCSSAKLGESIFSPHILKKNGYVFWWLIFRNHIITSSVLVKKTVINEVGIFKDTEEFKISEDYDLWLRITKKYPIRFIDEPLINYEVHDLNISACYLTNLDYADRVIRLNLQDRKLPNWLKNKIYALTELKKFIFTRDNKKIAKKHLLNIVKIDMYSVLARVIRMFY